MTKESIASISTEKMDQGVVWGKDPKYYEGKDKLLEVVANKVKLISTARTAYFHHGNLEYRGHLTANEWLQLLGSSKFLLGLEHPLLGPSAVDAVSLGCMFINPIYDKPILEAGYTSQHPYIAEVAPQYVCSYHIHNMDELSQCIDTALQTTLTPLIPVDLTEAAYLTRFQNIFEL